MRQLRCLLLSWLHRAGGIGTAGARPSSSGEGWRSGTPPARGAHQADAAGAWQILGSPAKRQGKFYVPISSASLPPHPTP